jgi:uncharacterized lipoprotein YajG
MKTIVLFVGLILLAGCEQRSEDQSSTTNSLNRPSGRMDTNNPPVTVTNRISTNPPQAQP